MKRRAFIASALGLSAGIPAYAKFFEPGWLKFNQIECNLFSGQRQEPVRLLHLSDLHASPAVPNYLIEHAIDVGLSAKPDLICITGDFVTMNQGFDAAWLERQLRRANSAAPAFASLGNHDGGRWAHRHGGFRSPDNVASIVTSSGIRLLLNNHCVFKSKGRTFDLVGLGDLWAGEMEPAGAFPATPSDRVVLLSHNPDSKDFLDNYHWDLMLSGHTHGGQLSLPYFGTPFAPVVDQRYVRGLKTWNDRLIHVTPGVGNLHGVRFNCRPECSLLLLR
jgi:predicted MPP superfamily phosphohydrolase